MLCLAIAAAAATHATSYGTEMSRTVGSHEEHGAQGPEKSVPASPSHPSWACLKLEQPVAARGPDVGHSADFFGVIFKPAITRQLASSIAGTLASQIVFKLMAGYGLISAPIP